MIGKGCLRMLKKTLKETCIPGCPHGPQPPNHLTACSFWTIWERTEYHYCLSFYVLCCLIFSSLGFCLSNVCQQENEHCHGTQESWVQRGFWCWANWSQSEKINKNSLGAVLVTMLWPREPIWTEQWLHTQGDCLYTNARSCFSHLPPALLCPRSLWGKYPSYLWIKNSNCQGVKWTCKRAVRPNTYHSADFLWKTHLSSKTESCSLWQRGC